MTGDFDDDGAGAPAPLRRNLLIGLALAGVFAAGVAAVAVVASSGSPSPPPAKKQAGSVPGGPSVSQGKDLDGFSLTFSGWRMEGDTLVGVVVNGGTGVVGRRVVRASAFDGRGVELNGVFLEMPDVPEGGKGEVRISLPPGTARVVLGCTF